MALKIVGGIREFAIRSNVAGLEETGEFVDWTNVDVIGEFSMNKGKINRVPQTSESGARNKKGTSIIGYNEEAGEVPMFKAIIRVNETWTYDKLNLLVNGEARVTTTDGAAVNEVIQHSLECSTWSGNPDLNLSNNQVEMTLIGDFIRTE